ncbi:MAG: M12 family metallo-peptidase [candidate division Zixibacteria bacterium]|nr:M12 family metallo-peptidase [candidate division Zixibacteria bacterium]
MSFHNFCNHSKISLSFLLAATVLFLLAFPSLSMASIDQTPLRPLNILETDMAEEVIIVGAEQTGYDALKSGTGGRIVQFPLPTGEILDLDLTPFQITTPDTRFLIGGPGGSVATLAPEVIMFRGKIAGDETSYAYLAFSNRGMGSGYVQMDNGEIYYLSQTPQEAVKGWNGKMMISRKVSSGDLPSGVDFCGVKSPSNPIMPPAMKALQQIDRGRRLANMAVDSDKKYYDIFGDVTAAQSYMLMVIGAVNDIYMRDLDLKLLLNFVRVWPAGAEPFGADDLGGFQDYWIVNEDPSQYNFVYMFSGRRDLSYGGLSYVGGTCSGSATYGIVGFFNGSFPNPFGAPNLGNWDVECTAHEMGHGCGSWHTHDYYPRIDSCYYGYPSRGTIMSYCHTWAGFQTNIDLIMHRRVEEVIEADFDAGACMPYDCNGNNIDDAIDISLGESLDINSDGIPDECQDCNGNLILDPTDIINGMPDIDGNGVPDGCQTDCNTNGIPDSYETAQGLADDNNGNNVPDQCDPDCDNNSVPDFIEIASGAQEDFDRNNIPDICQDCDNDGVTDWIDMDRQHNLFVADQSDLVHEFHRASGYPIRNVAVGAVSNPHDLVFGPDRRLYVSSFDDNRIVRVNVDSNTTATFVTAGSGGLMNPTGLVFGPNGNLFVASNGDSRVIQYNGTTGALIGTFIAAGAGGLVQPYGLTFGPGGNLFVASSDNRILEYSGTTGAFVRTFITAGSGALSAPRGLAFFPGGNLLVASNGNDRILEYNRTTGAFAKIFNDSGDPVSPWGICIGPNGNVFVSNNAVSAGLGYVVVLQYMPVGRYYMRYVRGANNGLVNPTGIAFRPSSPHDCNGNGGLDACDIAEASSLDENHNGVPDECDSYDFDIDGVLNANDNCPFTSNSNQADVDGDLVGDLCDNCPTVSNPDQADSDHDGIGDACPYLCGDVNNSGVVNIQDITYLISYLYKGGPAPVPVWKVGDVNNSGIVNIQDITYLISYLYKGGPAPHCQ